MTLYETILGGTVIGVVSSALGIFIGGKGKLPKEDFQRICNERQNSCSTHICSEIGHMKESQKEMKVDIKEILKRVKINGS